MRSEVKCLKLDLMIATMDAAKAKRTIIKAVIFSAVIYPLQTDLCLFLLKLFFIAFPCKFDFDT